MSKYFLDNRFKDIANGETAFCIFGGPSAKSIDNIEELIQNNFTVTVNNNIIDYPNVDMYFTADNLLTRTYFETEEFFVHKFLGGKLLRSQANFRYNEDPIWITPKIDVFSKNESMIKIIGCNNFPSYNRNFTTGQTYYLDGIMFARNHKNTYICIEHRDESGESYPTLTLENPSTVETYGKNPMDFISGGNISSIVFQTLRYMGFHSVIVIGYADNGTSNGYDKVTQFEWSAEEIHAMSVHSYVWKDNLKVLAGGELFDQFDLTHGSVSETDLMNKKTKEELINRLNQL